MGEDRQDRQDGGPGLTAADWAGFEAGVRSAVAAERTITRRVIVPIVLAAALIAVYLLAGR